MGVGLGTATGLAAGLYHLVNHAIGKALAFTAIGVLVREFRTRNIIALEGTGRYYPMILFSLTIAFLHLIGLPPFGGFFSKLLLYQAFVEKQMYIMALMVIVTSVLSSYGYLRILEHLWHPPVPKQLIHPRSLAIAVNITMIIFIAAILSIGFLSPFITEYLRNVGVYTTNGYMEYIDTVYKALHSLRPDNIITP